MPCRKLTRRKSGSWVKLAGLVLIRQRPGSAKGVIFVTIEDESGVANLIVWPHMMERYRRTVLGAQLLGIEGRLQREGVVTHVVAHKLHDFSHYLGHLARSPAPTIGRTRQRMVPGSRDFR